MKILFILPEYHPHSGGGICTYYQNYLKALNPQVTEISILVGSGYVQSEETYVVDGINIEYLKPNYYQKYLSKFSKFDLYPEYRNNIAASWAMFEQAKEGEGFDIIECTDFGLGFVPWLVNHKKPVITRLHGSSGQIDLHDSQYKTGLIADLYRQSELILLEQSDMLISHSISNKIYWEKIFKKKEVVHLYPIYENQIEAIPYEKKNEFGIVCARIQNWKGPDILCKALELLINLDITINWFGKDTAFNRKITTAKKLSKDYPKIWNKKIIPKTPLPNQELLEVQKFAKFAIIPSTWDMFNFTALEYLSSGTVLICSEGAGVSELIENGVNGYKYSKDDYVSLSKHILKVINLSKEDYEKITRSGKKMLTQQLNTKKNIDNNLLIYQAILNVSIHKKDTTFIDEIFKPSQHQYTLDSTLKNVSLKKLIHYISLRVCNKLFSY